MNDWYLLYCKNGQIPRAIRNLQNQGVTCQTPLIHLEKIVRGKRVILSEPLFPDYLFIDFDINQIHTTTICSTRGVRNFVRFGAMPVRVPDELIRQLCTYQLITDPATPLTGDGVIITRGKYAGLEAIFSEPDGEVRSVLLLNILDKQKQLNLKNTWFKKL